MMNSPVSQAAVQSPGLAHQVAALCGALRASTASIGPLIDALVAGSAAAGETAAAADLERIRTAVVRLQLLIEKFSEAPRLAREEPEQWLAASAHLRHDLRTPLNAVMGYGDMLVDDWRDAGQLALVSDIRRVLAASNDLLALIDAAPLGL
jgi:signal transduction histidine kinase